MLEFFIDKVKLFNYIQCSRNSIYTKKREAFSLNKQIPYQPFAMHLKIVVNHKSIKSVNNEIKRDNKPNCCLGKLEN